MLIQLPNGDWVSPETITSVRVQSGIHPECLLQIGVVIDLKYGVPSWCQADDPQALRDQIAEQVNRSLYRPEGA